MPEANLNFSFRKGVGPSRGPGEGGCDVENSKDKARSQEWNRKMTALATAAASAKQNKKYVLRLHVAGATSASRRAILIITSVCSEHLQGKCDLEVIDI